MAQHGLEIRDSLGRVIFDTSTSLMRVVQVINLDGTQASGSYTIPNFYSNRVVTMFNDTGFVLIGGNVSSLHQPVITVQGNVVSWQYTVPYNSRIAGSIIVGLA